MIALTAKGNSKVDRSANLALTCIPFAVKTMCEM